MKYIALCRDKEGGYGIASLGPSLQALSERPEIRSLWVTYTTAPPPITLLPLRRGSVASVSLHSDDELDPTLLTDLPGFSALFSAEEAIPVAYERSWKIGTETPGACLLTLFHRRPGVDYATFIERWHEGHTPRSLELHPLWHYNRNVVTPLLAGDADGEFDGIVEEHVRERRDLTNPFRFYGPLHLIIPRMISILVDILGFIDLSRIETYLTCETIFKDDR